MIQAALVTKRGEPREDEKARNEALFRFRVLSSVLHPDETAGVRALVTALAAEHHSHPTRGEIKVSDRTLWAWLAAYREGGVEGLRPRQRSDRGGVRALSSAQLERAEALRRQVPRRWTSTIVDIMKREAEEAAPLNVHRSTVDRHLRQRGASRRQLRVLGAKPTIKMAFENFGDLWVGDFHDGPKILAPDGRIVGSKLSAFIDHKTRYPLEDRWYLDETIGSLRDTLLRVFLKWGQGRVIYVDRGACYRAEQLAYSLATLETKLVYSRPYYSQGRGVIERWWQLADAFQAEVEGRQDLLTLPELNRLWVAFRTLRYLEERHSEIGMKPTEAIASVVPQPLDPAIARELFLVRADRDVHRKDSCVSVEGQRFLVDGSLRGRKVTVRYDPADLSSVLIIVDGKRVQRALPQPIGQRSATPSSEAAPRQAPGVPTDYLGMLRAEYDRRLTRDARAAAYADLGELVPGFDESAFFKVLADLTDKSLRGNEAEEARNFWNTLGPLPETLVRAGLEHAVRLRGTGRHIRVYLDILRTFTLARLQSPAPEKEKSP